MESGLSEAALSAPELAFARKQSLTEKRFGLFDERVGFDVVLLVGMKNVFDVIGMRGHVPMIRIDGAKTDNIAVFAAGFHKESKRIAPHLLNIAEEQISVRAGRNSKSRSIAYCACTHRGGLCHSEAADHRKINRRLKRLFLNMPDGYSTLSEIKK